MKHTIHVENRVQQTPRLQQLAGLFDLTIEAKSQRDWELEIDLNSRPWNVGLIVGQSGSGKSTVARHLFGSNIEPKFEWPADQSVVDGFPDEMKIKDITGLLSSVGFSSPPAWLVPFRCLSNGQQFRANMARLLAETPADRIAVCDEFTSVVGRTGVEVASVAIAKSVRRRKQRFVAVTCHFDVIDWLDPDWVLNIDTGETHWRLERRRPPVELRFYRVHPSAWKLFRSHHYLSGALSSSARCFVAECLIDGQWRVAAFSSMLHYHGASGSAWREHRTVCLPDYQGLGIGNALADWTAAATCGLTGLRYRSVTSHPAMIYHRAKSPTWDMFRAPSRSTGSNKNKPEFNRTSANSRNTASFLYTGPALDQALAQQMFAERQDLYLPTESVCSALQILQREQSGTIPDLARRIGCSSTALQAGFTRLVELQQLAKSATVPVRYRLTGKPIPLFS